MTIVVCDMSFSMTEWTDLTNVVIVWGTCGVCKVTAGEGCTPQYSGYGEEFQMSAMSLC